MKTLIWIFRFVVFIALFGLAVKNSAMVDLRFYFDQHIEVPLSLVVLGAFVLGAALGISAAIATLLRQRHELGRLQRRASDRS
ncbi:MAG: LapA family protein [Georgfuchsia sp.]